MNRGKAKSGFVKVVDISGRTLIDSRNETFSRTSLIRLPMENRKGVFIVEIASFPRKVRDKGGHQVTSVREAGTLCRSHAECSSRILDKRLRI